MGTLYSELKCYLLFHLSDVFTSNVLHLFNLVLFKISRKQLDLNKQKNVIACPSYQQRETSRLSWWPEEMASFVGCYRDNEGHIVNKR